MTANWIMVAVGIWAMISPWVLGFSSISPAKWNGLIIGLILVLLNIWIMFGDAVPVDIGEDKKEKVADKGQKS